MVRAFLCMASNEEAAVFSGRRLKILRTVPLRQLDRPSRRRDPELCAPTVVGGPCGLAVLQEKDRRAFSEELCGFGKGGARGRLPGPAS